MLKVSLKLPTLSTSLRLSTMICALSLTVLAQGCATRTVPAPQAEVPQTLLTKELPNWKSWFANWLTLVQSAADCINEPQQTTTPSQKQ